MKTNKFAACLIIYSSSKLAYSSGETWVTIKLPSGSITTTLWVPPARSSVYYPKFKRNVCVHVKNCF